ncbi:MAG: 4-hydroxy-3-methylbut-2-en-1-yl diphosphate synthase, partial [Pseudomonadota bacterium]
YLSGIQDHKIENESMVDHIVDLVEKKAEELDAERARIEAAE